MKCVQFKTIGRLSLLFLTIWSSLHAQQMYILTDSSKSDVSVPRSGNKVENSHFIRVWSEGEIEKYYPSDLREYGLSDGRIYVSGEIELPQGTKQVFLERKAFRDLYLFEYHYAEGYKLFLAPDSLHFVSLTEENFRQEITKWIQGCPDMVDALRKTKFSRRSIEKLLLFYQRCKGGIIPSLHLGFSLGYTPSIFSVPRRRNDIGILAILPDFPFDLLEGGIFQWNPSFSGGFFLEVPAGISPFSIQTGLEFSYTRFSELRRFSTKEIYFQGDFFSMELPIHTRYTLLNRRWRPYIQVGMSLINNFSQSLEFYELQTRINTGSRTDLASEELIGEYMYGFGGGIGLSRMVDEHKRLSLQFHARRAMGFSRALAQDSYMLVINYSFSR